MAGSVASFSVGLACLVSLMAAVASATQFRVGGSRGWSVPDANAEPYNSWAGRMRFQIGDQLLFVYPKETDAVVVVDQAAYDACNTTAAVAGGGRFDDGSTVFTFDRSGPFFFISGNESSCRAGEKLIVVVMADRHHTPPSPPMPSPLGSVAVAGDIIAYSVNFTYGAVAGDIAWSVSFTYGAVAGSFVTWPCSDDNAGIAAGGRGTVAVDYSRRRRGRVTAAAGFGQPAVTVGSRGGELDDAGVE
uniref:Phytocyanin domain-containing protein n=1 Tax=Leersia perrieri TaxID=77586 RepID=A0A0D9WTB1_9ORYZ